jgi:hypothetical protein
MPAADLIIFEEFVEAIFKELHKLDTDQLKIALSNTAPDAAGDTVLADITEVSYTNCSARTITTLDASQTAGLFKLVIQDLVLSASGGPVGPFRYIVLYNDGAPSDQLIGYFDYGTALTLNDGESLNLNFDDSLGVLEAEIV